MEKLIIVGLSTTARHVLSFVRMYRLYEVVGFAVNEEYRKESSFLGLPVYSLEHLEEEYGEEKDFCVFVAMLWNHLNRDRRNLYEYCKSRGFRMANLISPTAVVRGTIAGDNVWIHDYVIIQNDAYLESNIAVMAFALIGANTHVASHCFFGARSLLGGGSTVGEQSFIGINATVFDDTRIGSRCIVGACTPVKRHLPDCSRYSTRSDDITIKTYAEEVVEDKLVFSLNKR